MNSRRITVSLGAAAGGLLAAFLQTAVAFADTTDVLGPAGGAPDITLALDTPFGDFTLPPIDVLPSPADLVGAVSGDGLTGGGVADTVGTWTGTLALDTPFGDFTLPPIDVLPSPADLVGAVSGDVLTAGGGVADTVGTWTGTLALDTPFGDFTLPPIDVLPSPADLVGAVSGDVLTAGGGVADTVGTSALDGLTGLLGLF
jgi:hypothetical protein